MHLMETVKLLRFLLLHPGAGFPQLWLLNCRFPR